MKKVISNVFLAGMLLFGTSVMFTSCKKPCKDVVCENGGTEREDGDDCLCDCTTGYEGDLCEVKMSTKFTGSYNTTNETCSSGTGSYGITVTEGTELMDLKINNLYDASLNTNATVTSTDKINIPSQAFGSGNISGSGTISGNTLTITYTVTLGGAADECTAVFEK